LKGVAVRSTAGEKPLGWLRVRTKSFLNCTHTKKDQHNSRQKKDTQATGTSIPYFLGFHGKNSTGQICPRLKIFLTVKIRNQCGLLFLQLAILFQIFAYFYIFIVLYYFCKTIQYFAILFLGVALFCNRTFRYCNILQIYLQNIKI